MAAVERARRVGNIAEIVEIILRFLPGRYVAIAAQVCLLWRETVERIRASRRKCAVYLSLGHAKFCEFSKGLVHVGAEDFIKQQCIEPGAVLLFTGHRPSSSTIILKNFLQSVRNCLPVRCPLIGCTGLGVIGAERSAGSPREMPNSGDLSLMMLPRYDGFEIRDFHVPLRNKYKKISGIGSFLPHMILPVKVVIVLAHPLSLGKLTKLTLAIRSKYGEEVVIVGGYSDSCLFYNTEVTTGEIIGLVLAGNLQSTSVLVSGKTTAQSWENLYDSIERLETSGVPKENCFSLMFSCVSRGRNKYRYENAECTAFNDRFPQTFPVGFFGRGAFGCDREELKLKGKKPGGRDFLQTNASVLCLISLTPVRRQPCQ